MRYRNSQAHRTWWFPAVAIAIVAALTWAPVVAAGVSAASSELDQSQAPQSQSQAPFTSSPEAAPVTQKVLADPVTTSTSATLVSALPKRPAPVPKKPAKATPKSTPKAASRNTATVSARTTTRTTTRTSTRTSTTTATRSTGTTSELSQARAILASLIAAHPICAGATVSIGTTPGGYQAVCYYKSGRILVSPTHTASLRTILNHEIWHIIDWRDNGRIDWGENVPR